MNNSFSQQDHGGHSVLKIIKNHYFIGFIIKDSETSRGLKVLQNILDQPKFKLKNVLVYNSLVSSFIYLGYLTEETATEFIKFLNPLLLAISNSISPINCIYSSVVSVFDDHKQTININYDAEILTKKIIPYLRKYGVDPILGEHMCNIKPTIPLVSVKLSSANINNARNGVRNVYPPRKKNFMISTIDLYRGEPVEVGGQIIGNDNNMAVELITSYPLKGV